MTARSSTHQARIRVLSEAIVASYIHDISARSSREADDDVDAAAVAGAPGAGSDGVPEAFTSR